MLPADLDDEQRADIAHEHPIDVESGPSSPSSGVPSYVHPRLRHKSSKSASRHRSHTTTEGSSSHLLARLIARDEEVREVNALLVVTSERLDAESTRANEAERRALDYFSRVRSAMESRDRAEQESARLREELKLYKLQLENAQKEIFRAQDIINQVSAQRNEAEADAARARTKARKLQEEKLVMFAREDGRRQGYKEGLSIGRRMGYDEGRTLRRPDGPSTRSRRYALPNGEDEDEDEEQDETEDERNDPRSRTELRSRAPDRQPPVRSASVPPARTYDTAPHAATLPVPTLVTPLPIRSPSHEPRVLSAVEDSGEPETILPIPVRTNPSVPNLPTDIPADGWIPEADPHTSYIPVPAPHGLSRPVPTTPSTITTELHESRPNQPPEPAPYPPVRSRDYAYDPPLPVPIPRARTPSIISRSSTHVSQYDLVSAPKRSGSSLRNEIYAGRARSGSQPTHGTVSRNEGHYHPARGQADHKVEQWRADPDVVSTATTSTRTATRSVTPSAPQQQQQPQHQRHERHHYHHQPQQQQQQQPQHHYYPTHRPRELVMPAPLADAGARSHTPAPMEPTATQPQAPEAQTSPTRGHSPLDYLRQRFQQRPNSSTSIPNIVVESPTDSASNPSPAGTTVTRPELLSPESANRPLPSSQDDDHQRHVQQQPSTSSHQHHHQQHHHHQQQPSQQQPSSYRYQNYLYDNAYRSKTPVSATPWAPVGSVPTSRGPSDRYDVSRHVRSVSTPTRGAAATARGQYHYEESPLPPGIMYPEPPIRSQTAHQRHRDRDATDGEREREGEGSLGAVAKEDERPPSSASPPQRPMSVLDDLRVRSF